MKAWKEQYFLDTAGMCVNLSIINRTGTVVCPWRVLDFSEFIDFSIAPVKGRNYFQHSYFEINIVLLLIP